MNQTAFCGTIFCIDTNGKASNIQAACKVRAEYKQGAISKG